MHISVEEALNYAHTNVLEVIECHITPGLDCTRSDRAYTEETSSIKEQLRLMILDLQRAIDEL